MTSPPISRDSVEWRTLKSWLITQIHKGQRALEDADPLIGERVHDVARGRIAAYRALIQEVEPELKVEAEKLEGQALDETIDY